MVMMSYNDLSRTSSMQHRHSSDSDEVPLIDYKSHTLHKPELVSCDICDHVSTSIYANFEHNASHIIIPLVKLTLHECEDCLYHFTSLEELISHANLKRHRTSQVLEAERDIILRSIIKKQLVIKCHDLFKENSGVIQNSGVIRNTEVSKETNPINDAFVKSEIPTYVISDSGSDGRNSPLSDPEETGRKEQRQTKIEDFQTKAERVTETIKEYRDTEEVYEAFVRRTSTSTGGVASPSKSDYSDSDNNSEVVVIDSEDNYKEINVGNEDIMKFYQSDEEIREVDKSVLKVKNQDCSNSSKRKKNSDYQPLINRLVFEEDLDDDVTKGISPNRSGTQNKYLLGRTSTNFKPNSIIIGSLNNGNSLTKKFYGSRIEADLDKTKILDIGVEENIVEYPESVPYETLMEPQICDCRYCGRCFCNRMQLILHESTHLRIRKPRPTLCPFCERFYAGNYRGLRKHLVEKHPHIDPDQRRLKTHVCKSCHLSYYNFSRHIQYYHNKKEKIPRQPVFKKHRYQIMKFCNMCLLLCTNEQSYKQLGRHREIGKTQICSKCNNGHFTINLVRKMYFNTCQKVEVYKSMSNNERLVRIKRKFRMMKEFNKCFWDGFISRRVCSKREASWELRARVCQLTTFVALTTLLLSLQYD